MVVPSDKGEVKMPGCVDQRSCEVGPQRSGSLAFAEFNRTKHAVETRTGIEFPTVLNNTLASDNYRTSEVNVSRFLCVMVFNILFWKKFFEKFIFFVGGTYTTRVLVSVAVYFYY